MEVEYATPQKSFFESCFELTEMEIDEPLQSENISSCSTSSDSLKGTRCFGNTSLDATSVDTRPSSNPVSYQEVSPFTEVSTERSTLPSTEVSTERATLPSAERSYQKISDSNHSFNTKKRKQENRLWDIALYLPFVIYKYLNILD